ncbi:binding-protein-dependent transport systems inner membrane component [Ligilactobacillus acidipiscis DSM 15836]|jgi:osmoprotectant transport system permease protein|uniref:ABC transporter permease n=2 Tax=Ligilactobacillus acidipiscis TaxID=89059 RepID=A0A1K1KMH5_9LACO|nr:ABC transporter permease [Ligilactobacillus acidipiscis]KRM25519.1 binding-protein-dependent transport systems inner membrane component [Ligilactobacillus acidipiscis DSM 15836]MCI1954578.1 ABC transporter permease [Ligilactobacillus acidipiscis]WEV57652.1 ABC transporter permease [Ligilactobacillus acidipiscis]SFV40110.1 Osmotically activated L-carnitine/choline ABC transporter, permease protein OpuCB [Ligilactobacillus acidipiscis]GAW63739.1 glycine betaine/carnitine/choline ABC transport
MMSFLNQYGGQLVTKTWEQLYISAIALLLGVLVAVPIGILLTRFPKTAKIIVGIASMLQTVPSLALLALMIPIFGIGKVPAIVALFIYSLLPILRNTYIGMNDVDPTLKDSAKGMGMTTLQSIWQVELPMAMQVIMAGIRLSAVYVIAWATLASYIGAGGLGDFIFNGLNLYQPDLIIGGTIPVTILALVVDFLLGKLEYRLTPISQR